MVLPVIWQIPIDMNVMPVLLFNDILVNIFLRMIVLLGSHSISIVCVSILSIPLPNPNFCETILYAETNISCSHSISFSSIGSWDRSVDSSWISLTFCRYLPMSSCRSDLRVVEGQ